MGKVSKRSSTKGHVGDAPPAVNVAPSVRDEALDAIESLLLAIRGSPDVTYYWYSIIGNNGGSLLHRMGIDPFAYAALMLVAGLMKYRKVRKEDRYTLTANEEIWTSFINARKLSDFIQSTKVGVCRW